MKEKTLLENELPYLLYVEDLAHPRLTDAQREELMGIFFNGNYFSRKFLEEAINDHPLKLTGAQNHTMYSKEAPFLFRCGVCTDIGFPIQWYQIVLDTVGGAPFLHKKTDDYGFWLGHTGFNLSRIAENDTRDYQSSSANVIKGFGYVCDHCRDSCFDEKGNLLK